jgi:hypothetical protein
MNANDEVTRFFSEVARIEQIDRLHRLLLPWIKKIEQDLELRLRTNIETLAKNHADRWILKSGSPNVGTLHIGVVPHQSTSTQPVDLWVHLGWNSNLLHDAWVGVYTAVADEALLGHIRTAVSDCFDRQEQEPFYPIFQYEEPWPGIKTGHLTLETQLARLSDVIPGEHELIVGRITQRLAAIIDRLDRVR